MFNPISLCASMFSGTQITTFVVLGIIIALLLALNIVIFIMARRRGAMRLLYSNQLQRKREALLLQLESLRSGEFTALDDDDSEVDAEADAEEALALDDEDDSEEPQSAEMGEMRVLTEDSDELTDAEILTVARLSYAAREKLGFLDEEYDGKRYYVRYISGFESKLRSSSDEVKDRYAAFLNEVAQYKGVKVRPSFRQQRIYKGRTTLCKLRFGGKTLCAAFALNPADYADTKYKGLDKSDVKCYENTPMVMRFTSARRLEYAKYLLLQVAYANALALEEHPQTSAPDVTELSHEQLFLAGAERIKFLGEVPDTVPWESVPEPIIAIDDESAETTDVAAEDDEPDDYAEESGYDTRVVYNRSYTARIIQANDELKARYSELKNYIMSYNKIRNRVSWRREAFCFGREYVLAFNVRGKTLCLYLSENAARFKGTKYKVVDLTEKNPNAKMPSMYKIKSDRSTKFAKQIIDMLLSERGGEKIDIRPVDYRPVYKSTNNLIKAGYIKVRETVVPVTGKND